MNYHGYWTSIFFIAAVVTEVSSVGAEPADAQFETTPFWQSDQKLGVGGFCIGDVNQDGLMDVGVATYDGSSEILPEETLVFVSGPEGLESSASWTSTDAVWSTGCLFFPLREDGLPDLIVGNGGSGASPSVIYFNDGALIKTSPSWKASNPFPGSAGNLAIGDANEDGFPDLFFAYHCMVENCEVPVAGYFSADGAISKSPSWQSFDRGLFSGVALGDPDRSGVELFSYSTQGDGYRRLFWLPHVPIHALHRILVREGNGNPGKVTFNLRSGYVLFSIPPPALAPVEFLYEASNQLDVAAAANPGPVLIYSHKAGGIETTAGWSANLAPEDPYAGYQRVAFVDFNRDGFPELFAAGKSNTPCVVFPNEGGVLSTTPSWSWAKETGECEAEDLDVLDANGDGFEDIMTTSWLSATIVHVFINSGGVLEAAPSFTLAPAGESLASGAAADVDGDGMPDLLMGYASVPAAALKNLGLPLPAPVVSSITPVEFPGGNPVDITISGEGFQGPIRVYVEDNELLVTEITPNQILATVPGEISGTNLRFVVVNTDLQTVIWPPIPTNLPPVVEAGENQTITLPDPAILDATVSDDGLPDPPVQLTFTWTQVQGPGTVTFGDAEQVDTTAEFSVAGNYQLRLTVFDGQRTASDEIAIVVKTSSGNAPPIVDAGLDQTIRLPAKANLFGTVTDDGLPDPPGTLITTWSKIGGPGEVTFDEINAKDTLAAFGSPGNYNLRLTADDGELQEFDEVAIVVEPAPPNSPPTVNAGTDQTILITENAILAGTAADDGFPDPPHSLTTTWGKDSGPGDVIFGHVNVLDTTAGFSLSGTYVLTLTADDGEKQASDTVTIEVVPVNQAPAVYAGEPQTIKLSQKAVLDGSASDDGLPNPPGQISVGWTQVSGPGTVTFEGQTSVDTLASFSAVGDYQLRLTANDGELESSDEVKVTVIADNQPPTVEAGSDLTITLPETASLSGSAQDDQLPDPPGYVTTLWTKEEGPGEVTFENAYALITRATFSAAGAYRLKLTADDGELEANDMVTVTVAEGDGESEGCGCQAKGTRANFGESLGWLLLFCSMAGWKGYRKKSRRR